MISTATVETILTGAILGVLAVTLLAGEAQANIPDQRTVAVSYRDLDLRSPAGQAVLDQRIARAARVACGTPDGRTLDDLSRVAACRADAIDKAHQQIAVQGVGADR